MGERATVSLGHIDDLDFTEFIRPGDTVVWGQACAEPLSLTERLMAQRAAIGRFRCFLGIPVAKTIQPEHAAHVDLLSYCGTGSNAALRSAGALDIVPAHYSALPGLLAAGSLRADVVLLQLPPADEDGNHSPGLAADYVLAAAETARMVIAEVSDQVPVTCSARSLARGHVGVEVRTSRPPAEFIPRPPDAVSRLIASNVAGLIQDGATLQVGIGALPDAVLAQLLDRRDLGIHSGIVTDSAARLIEAGVVTNARKSLDRGVSVAGFLMGSERLFKLAHRNPAIQLRDTRYTHDPEVLAAQDRLVTINSALQVDLSGQVNAEVADGRYIGAVGGAADFLRGAARSRGGLPVVALPSTAGTVSRIVASLPGPVTTARSDAGVVVTEFGVADLRGQPLRVRQERLIAIAHPDHRRLLEKELREEDTERMVTLP